MLKFTLSDHEKRAEYVHVPPSDDSWFVQLQRLLELETDNANLEKSNPNLIKAFHLLNEKQLLSVEKKRKLLEQIKSILSLSKKSFDEKLQQFLTDIEFPDSTEAFLHSIGLKPNVLKPLQTLLRIKNNLVERFTAEYAYQGYQEQGYEPIIFARYKELLSPLFNRNPRIDSELFICSQEDKLQDIHWNKLIYFIFKDYQNKGIIQAQIAWSKSEEDFCALIEDLLNMKKIPAINESIMQYFHANIDDFTAFLILTNNNEQLVTMVIDYLEHIKSAWTYHAVGIILSALKKQGRLYAPLLEAINEKFRIADKLDLSFFLGLLKVPTPLQFDPLLLLDFCKGDQIFKLFSSFLTQSDNFSLLYQRLTFPQSHDQLLSQCDKLNAEEFFLLMSVRIGGFGNLLLYFIQNTTKATPSKREHFRQIITKLHQLIESKLTSEQKGLLLQQNNPDGSNILHHACLFAPELFPFYLGWLKELDHAIQFSIFRNNILHVCILHRPELLDQFLDFFNKLDVSFRRNLLVCVSCTGENVLHCACELDGRQLTSLFKAIKDVDNKIFTHLLLQEDTEKTTIPIISLLSKNKLIDIVSKEIELFNEAEQQFLFNYSSRRNYTFMNALFQFNPALFIKWLFPFLTHFEFDISHPSNKTRGLLVALVNGPSIAKNIPVFYEAMFGCYQKNPLAPYMKINLKYFLGWIIIDSYEKKTVHHHVNYIISQINTFLENLELLKELLRYASHTTPIFLQSLLSSISVDSEKLNKLLMDEYEYISKTGLNLNVNLIHYTLSCSRAFHTLEVLLKTYKQQNLLCEALLAKNSQHNTTVLQYTMLYCAQSSLIPLLSAISSLPLEQQSKLMTGDNNIFEFSVKNAPSVLKDLISLPPQIHEQCLGQQSLWKEAMKDPSRNNLTTLVSYFKQLDDVQKSSVSKLLGKDIETSINQILESQSESDEGESNERNAKRHCSHKP